MQFYGVMSPRKDAGGPKRLERKRGVISHIPAVNADIKGRIP
jgi:hypothetical protein